MNVIIDAILGSHDEIIRDDPVVAAATFRYHGLEEYAQGAYSSAKSLLEEALARFRAEGMTLYEGQVELELAWVALAQGDHRAAEPHLQAARRIAVEAADSRLYTLASIATTPEAA